MIEDLKCYSDGEPYYSDSENDAKAESHIKHFGVSGDGSVLSMGGYVKDRSYDFILKLADSLLETLRSCGKYCDRVTIHKCTDGDGRIYYVLKWE